MQHDEKNIMMQHSTTTTTYATRHHMDTKSSLQEYFTHTYYLNLPLILSFLRYLL